MKAFNHYRYSFENQFFQYLKGQISLEEMIDNLREYEEKAIEEFLDKEILDKNKIYTEEEKDTLGFAFRYFDGDTTINTLRNLEGDLSQGNRNQKRTLELMELAVSLDTTYELQIFIA